MPARAIEQFIDEASRGDTLRIMSPVIDDQTVIRKLQNARGRGVIIMLLTSLSDGRKIKTKGWDASRKLDKHNEAVRNLAETGVLLRSCAATPHGKFLLRNDCEAVFGSVNLTHNALRSDTIEAAVFLKPDHVRQLSAIFKLLWRSSPLTMKHNKGAVSIVESDVSLNPLSADELNSACESNPQVAMSAFGVSRAVKLLIRHINQAESRIVMAAMTLFDVDKIPGLEQACKDALKRGVRIEAVVRREIVEDAVRRGVYPDGSTAKLIQHGLKLYGTEGFHAKGVLIDDSWCSIQSANINPYSLCTTRQEVNVEFYFMGKTTNPVLAAYATLLDRLIREPQPHVFPFNQII